jgi:hypothetical protein
VLGVLLESLDQQDSEDAVHFILLLTLFSDVLSPFSFVGANINNFLLTFQGKKVYKKCFFFITCQTTPSPTADFTAPFAHNRLHLAQGKLVNLGA